MTKEKVLCPRCGGRLGDTNKGVRFETVVVDDNNTNTEYFKSYFYIKCSRCKSIVGIRKIES